MEEPGFDEVSEEEIQAAAEVDAGTLAAAPRAKRKLYTEMTPEKRRRSTSPPRRVTASLVADSQPFAEVCGSHRLSTLFTGKI